MGMHATSDFRENSDQLESIKKEEVLAKIKVNERKKGDSLESPPSSCSESRH
jgi:hypothetical protein